MRETGVPAFGLLQAIGPRVSMARSRSREILTDFGRLAGRRRPFQLFRLVRRVIRRARSFVTMGTRNSHLGKERAWRPYAFPKLRCLTAPCTANARAGRHQSGARFRLELRLGSVAAQAPTREDRDDGRARGWALCRRRVCDARGRIGPARAASGCPRRRSRRLRTARRRPDYFDGVGDLVGLPDESPGRRGGTPFVVNFRVAGLLVFFADSPVPCGCQLGTS